MELLLAGIFYFTFYMQIFIFGDVKHGFQTTAEKAEKKQNKIQNKTTVGQYFI